jgi:hypothetical protein
MKCYKEPRTATNYIDKQTKLKKTDMRLDTWNVTSRFTAGSLITVVKEQSKLSDYFICTQC